MNKQLDLSGINYKQKGGHPTQLEVYNRRAIVEKLLLEGKSATQIAALTDKNGQKLGNIKTILSDIKKIQTRWLEQDTEWFHRARLARIEAENHLDIQYTRLCQYLTHKKLTVPQKLNIEDLITKNISMKEEISSGMDPEELIKKTIMERIEETNEKI